MYQNRRICILLLVGTFAAWLSGGAAASEVSVTMGEGPDEPTLDVREREFGVYFHAENPFDFPITVTLDLTAQENLNTNRALPATVVVPANQRMPILQLTPRRRSESWSYSYDWWWQPGSRFARHDNSYLYALPYAPGEAFRVTQGFEGELSHEGLDAIDWAMPEGTPIHAAREGRVIRVVSEFTEGGFDAELKHKSNYIMILHPDGTVAVYAHLQPEGSLVEPGQEVARGEAIGLSGNTGYSKGPHLHFEVRRPGDHARTRRTVPVRFETVGRSGVVLRQGQSYTAPGEPDRAEVPNEPVVVDEALASDSLNAVQQLLVCRALGEASTATPEPFAPEDTVYLDLAVMPGQYLLSVVLEHEDRPGAEYRRTIITSHHRNRYVLMLNLDDLPDPRGTWRVRAYAGSEFTEATEFDVR